MSHHKAGRKSYNVRRTETAVATATTRKDSHLSSSSSMVIAPNKPFTAGMSKQGLKVPAAKLTSRSVGFTDVATLLGGAASSGLAAATIIPALPVAVVAAAAAGSFAAFLIGRRIEVTRGGKS